ncbi:MAG TPA: glycosyltransferase family 2 protein, partial [Halanaerobiales bacterium]|nr:glycosyltransferase family 2 protein [Halanaerobiales bacterium]
MPGIETSVIIPTHNRKETLFRCLMALNEQNYPATKFEILIIDDGSTDGTEKMIKKIKIKSAHSYHYQKQSGPAAARNLGLKLARGEFIIFIDDDIIVVPGFIETHIKEQKKKTDIIVHGPVIYTNNPENPGSEEKKISDFSRAFFATGNVSIRKKHLIKAGFFNEKFKEYGWEDLELGFRLKKMGLKAVYNPEAKGFHLKKPFSLKGLPAILKREKARGRTALILCEINPSWEIKLATLNWPPFFYLARLLTLANWPYRKSTYKLLKFFHKKKIKLIRNLIVYFMKLKAYFDG